MNRNPLNKQLRTPVIAVAIAAYLAGCASVTEKNAQRVQPAQTAHGDAVTPPFKGGGYYKDDGPGRSRRHPVLNRLFSSPLPIPRFFVPI